MNRIKIISGHFGSGKTEFSINYGIYLKKHFPKVAVVDLDIINTYFRIRERQDYLEKIGIECISSAIPQSNALDIPALSADILRPLENDDYQVVIDAGGNPKGILPLGRYKGILQKTPYEHFMVINRNRPETSNFQDALGFLRQIEAYSQTKVTGLINTTHMLKDTRVEDVYYGQELVKELSEKLGLPVVYTACIESVAEKLERDSILGEIFPLKLMFRDGWMC
ncbi:ATP-binding protein [Peptoniphilus sp. GNH]|nr:hypothetical protein HMPREF3189_00913 [Clostridiales bacterium KA00134]UHR03523.1 ATP-binding protein [Peptoniphilus sp. GNH]